MPLLFSLTQCGLSDLKAGEVCQKQAEAVPEKPATSRLFNARKTQFQLPNSCWPTLQSMSLRQTIHSCSAQRPEA